MLVVQLVQNFMAVQLLIQIYQQKMFKNIFGKEMSDDINLYVMHDKLNNASFRQKLDPIEKNIFQKKNPLELTFQNPLELNFLCAKSNNWIADKKT